MYNYEEILQGIPDKKENKNTTSHKFKKDLLEFFSDKPIKTCLEIGANWGYTTRVLSYLAEKVYAIDHSDENIKKVIENTRGRKNISCIIGNAYSNSTYMTIIDDIDLCFIDCVHDYPNVKEDIERSLRMKKEGKDLYISFDDYGHPTARGVKRAIDETIELGRMEVVKYIGHEEGFNVFGNVILADSEGIICKVL